MKEKSRAFLHHLRLSLSFVERDLKERYAGTSFGKLWLIISPLITLFIYTVIFSDFMRMRLGVSSNHYAYSIYLIPGLLSWNFFSILVGRLSTAVLDRASILKKISLPMYVYYIGISLTEFLFYFVAMLIGLIFLLLVGQPIGAAFLFVPPIMVALGIFAFSLGVVFSLFTPFFRDMREMVPVLLQLWFWATPIIYVKSMIESKFPWLITLNPVYIYIEPLQEIFLHDRAPGFASMISMFSLSLLSLLLAMWLYRKVISTIKDML